MGKDFLKQLGLLFCDDEGHPSLMRLMAMGAFVAGIIRFFMDDSTGGSILLGIAFAGKVTQKVAER